MSAPARHNQRAAEGDAYEDSNCVRAFCGSAIANSDFRLRTNVGRWDNHD